MSIQIGPPPLPYYDQPAIPGEGYLWTPGYWAWSPEDDDYYWVPGTWVLPPEAGLLWTPGYWAYNNLGYVWSGGYWARQVGFYGGLNYGYGYNGVGYQGGRWEGGRLRYNLGANNLGRGGDHHSTYRARLPTPVHYDRSGVNGGPDGARALQPTPAQQQWLATPHTQPTSRQLDHERSALTMPVQRNTVNHGAPQIAATRQPSGFEAPGAVRARPTATPQPQHPQQPQQQLQRPTPPQDRAPNRPANERPGGQGGDRQHPDR
jgi:hypothetical protein